MPAQTDAEIRRKARAFDAQAADGRADRRKIALASIARAGGAEGAEARRLLATESAEDDRKAKADDLAALPKSIAEAGGDSRAFSGADIRRKAVAESGASTPAASMSRKSMLVELRRQGLEPVRG